MTDLTISPRPAPTRRRGRLWLRVAEAFFARWPLYLLPVIAFGGLGLMQTRDSVKEYRSAGVLSVSKSPLLSTDEVRGTTIYSYETPGVGMARIVNEQLRTDQFVRSVAEGAGLGGALDAGQLGLLDIRSRVFAVAEGDTLITIVGTWSDPQTAQQLASSTIQAFRQFQMDTAVSDSSDVAEFWQSVLVTDQQAVDAAQTAYNDYVLQHPAPPGNAERPVEEQLEIQRLSDTLTKAEDKATGTQDKIEAAELQVQSARSAAGQTIRVVDEPTAPSAPQSTLMAKVSTLFIFVMLGVLISACAVLAAALLDRSVRSSDDVTWASGLPVVATVPDISSMRGRRGRAAAGTSLLG